MTTLQAPPNPSSYFSLHPRLQQAIVSELGWRSLRPVQEQAIPPLLAGDDSIILAPTAGGKTESAMFPLVSQMQESPSRSGLQVLYICPLKALINNLLPRLNKLTKMVGRESFAWHGEVGASHRKRFLKEPSSLLLTTPESLQVILSRQHIDHQSLFGNLQSVVIDEVHAFCGESRGDQLICLLGQLDRYTSKPVQRIGLSATVGNPGDLLNWLSADRKVKRSLIDPNSGEHIKQAKILDFHPVGDEPEDCAQRLAHLMKSTEKSLLFVDSRRRVESARASLEALGIQASTHHSSLSQELREHSEGLFRKPSTSKKAQTIVCTSTLELGLDVGDIGKVFQWGAPSTVSAFLQRLGRAGRRDTAAHMVFVTDQSESFLQAIALVQLATQKCVEPVQPSNRNFAVLVQQILLLILKEGALAKDTLWEQLGTPPCFSGIKTSEKSEVLQHLVTEDWLAGDKVRVRIGTRSEKEFGNSNFMDLLSVFEGGASVVVKTQSGSVLGTVDYGMACQLQKSGSSFLLGGGSWKVKRWNIFGQNDASDT